MVNVISTPKELTLETNWTEYCVRVAEMYEPIEAVNIYENSADFYFNSEEHQVDDVIENLLSTFDLLDLDREIDARETEDAAPNRELDVEGIDSPKAVRCSQVFEQ